MPSWGELLAKIDGQSVNFDELRLSALQRLSSTSNRPVIAYYSSFLQPKTQESAETAINLADIQGLMEVFRHLPGPNLDLILHSPGGQAEATDSLVRYMRARYSNIRVFVPLAAMSAATMWAMAADEIIMGKESQLGPIDPQVTLPNLQVPAGALLEQFETAAKECAAEPGRIAAWLPTLQQYPPGLLNICKSASELSKELVKQWLTNYMFQGDESRASDVAAWLADDKTHLSHSRAIRYEDLKQKGVKVTPLEDDPDLQDAVLTLHHLYMLTFQLSPALKIIENSKGSRYIVNAPVVSQTLQQPAISPS